MLKIFVYLNLCLYLDPEAEVAEDILAHVLEVPADALQKGNIIQFLTYVEVDMECC